MATVAELNPTDHTVQWCAGCLLPGSLIQKNPSIDKIENIAVGDRVLGSDGRYHQVTEVFAHNHTGRMYSVSSKCLGSTTLTGEHPILSVKREHAKLHNKEFELKWTRTDQLKHGDYLAFPILKEVQDMAEMALPLKRKAMDRKSKELPPKIPINGDFLLFCGYYVAEGHVHERELCFTFNLKEKQYIEDIVRISREIFGLNASVSVRDKKNTAEIYIAHAPLARLFEEWFGNGAERKKIPHFVMLLPPVKQEAFVRGMWRGDGWLGKGRATYKTVSRMLCEQLKVLLIRHQIVPVIGINKAYGVHRESYTIQVGSGRDLGKLSKVLGVQIASRPKGKVPSSIILEDFILTPIREISTFDYDGPVHNFEVEGVHSYVGENAALHNCGDFGIVVSVRAAISNLGLAPENVVLASGIGCSGKLPHYVKTYGFEGLHGRALPPATAIKLANHSLTVIAVGGDGDGYGIGMGHFIHTLRRNVDLTYLVHNNQVYGLTTGQTSPTSEKGYKSKSTPNGALEEPVNPLALAIAGGATFVARGYSGDMKHLTELIMEGVKHRGFALIDVLQPCVTYNKIQTYAYYQQRCYKLTPENHDKTDYKAAFDKAHEWGDKIPIGIFYQTQKPTYEDGLPQIKEKPLCKQDISNVDIGPILEEYV